MIPRNGTQPLCGPEIGFAISSDPGIGFLAGLESAGGQWTYRVLSAHLKNLNFCMRPATLVKGGVKVQRLADQNCDTPDLPTPPETGCQFVSVHLSYASPGADGFGSGEGSSLLLASAFRSRRFD